MQPTIQESIVILGAGGLAREALHWIVQQGGRQQVCGFYDEYSSNDVLYGAPVSRNFEGWTHKSYLVAVGNPRARERLASLAEAAGLVPCLPVIHPSSVVVPTARIHRGTLVGPNVVVSDNVTVGRNVYLNLGVTLGHDTVVGEFSCLSPQAAISGNCQFGRGVYVGTQAAVREKTKIGDWATVGMGAVVLKDVGVETVVVGNPARDLNRLKDARLQPPIQLKEREEHGTSPIG